MTESSAPATEVQNEIEALTGRDLQLWSIVLVMSVVLFLGFMAVALPPLAPGARSMKIEAAYLPQLFVGLAVLIILFNLYIIRQKQVVNVTRRALIREAVYSERLESFSLIDPHTQLLNRQALEKLVPRELARANRMGTSLSFMVMTTELNTVEKRSGARGRDKFVTEVAGVLRGTFRGSDTLFHVRAGEFLVVMPDTSEQQAQRAAERLLTSVDEWNVMTKSECEMQVACTIVQYAPGEKLSDVLLRARHTPRYSRRVAEAANSGA